MKAARILFLTLFITSTFYSQTILDSLTSSLENLEGKERVNTLNILSIFYQDLSAFDQSWKYAQEALELAEELNYSIGKIDAIINLSGVDILKGNYEPGYKNALIADSLSKENDYQLGHARALRFIAIAQMYEYNNPQSEENLQSALDILHELNAQSEIASTYVTLGVLYSNTGKIKEGVEYYIKAAELFEELDNSYKAAHAYLNLGSVYSSILNEYKTALQYTLKALRIFEKQNDKSKTAYCNAVIGTIYEDLGELEKAITYYRNAGDTFAEINNEIALASMVNNIGEIYKKRENYSEARSNYEHALELFKKYNYLSGIAIAQNNIGECNYFLGNYEEALKRYSQSEQLLLESNDAYKLAIVDNNIGLVYQNTNRRSTAITYFEKALANAQKVNALDLIRESYENLTSVYSESGNYEKAYEYMKLYVNVKDSLDDQIQGRELAELKTQYETAEKESEIELLKQKEKIQELEIENQQSFVYSLIIVIVLSIFVAFIFFARYTFKNKANKILEEQKAQIESQQEELKAINNELQKSEENLKQLNEAKDKFFSIIAHDLKSPFNSLIGITQLITEDFDDMSKDEIKTLNMEIHDASKRVYQLVDNLLQWARTQFDKIEINKEYFKINDLISSITELYQENARVKDLTLESELCNGVYIYADKNMVDSVIRNLVNNAIKFTPRGGNITVKSIEKENGVEISVKDSGVGIAEKDLDKLFRIDSKYKMEGTENETGTGLGLILSKEFILKNGGDIWVESKKDIGSTFYVSLLKSGTE